MANRVEITENVESAIGLNITGASVTVKFRGGAQAPVYDAENGGALLSQPLSTVNGKIGADSPSGAWVAAGEYDLVVTFGGDNLTYAWNADVPFPIVNTLPAGAGTSAPEDGETAIELYDAANSGAWLRRWRAAAAAWDMIGGPPPSGASLPGTPRSRQEFYLTGGSPAIQHQRFNGVSWEYVGTPPMVPVTGSPLQVKDVGQSGQIRAGRQLTAADFTTLAGLATTPSGLFNLGSVTNLGSGGALTNKGTVTFVTGIEGIAGSSARFTGSTAQALYATDASGGPFSIRTGSFGAWIRVGRRGVAQTFLSKWRTAGSLTCYRLMVDSTNLARVSGVIPGGGEVTVSGVSDVADGRWHHVVGIHDGSYLHLYVDGTLEGIVQLQGPIFSGNVPLNIGGEAADAGTATDAPFFGDVDEAFVEPDVMSDDQVRLIYAKNVAHGYSVIPRLAALGVRRSKRGAALVSADFPSQPLRLHSLVGGALTDQGSNNVALTNNNTALAVGGADGQATGAFNFITASTQSLSSTDTGLPAGTASRSYGMWIKSLPTGVAYGAMGWGTAGTNDARIVIGADGLITAASGPDSIGTSAITDGRWHFIVVTEDNAPFDGAKRRLYIDGRINAISTVLTSLTLAGANSFRIGANPSGTSPGTLQATQVFVFSGILTQEQIAVLYQKSSQEIAQSIKEPGSHVEAMDAANVYVILDRIDSNNRVDLAVAA